MINGTKLDDRTGFEQIERIGQSGESLRVVEATPSEKIYKLAAIAKLEKRQSAGRTSHYDHRGTHQFFPEHKTAGSAEAATLDPELLRNLKVGTSIEFTSGRSTKRVLLVKSISRQGGVYFFHDQHTKSTILCLTAVRLSECLHEGRARVLN